ncbi:hypothetical protein GOBAR_DD02861 [Gossypium barbadense]|nr:hypothetical protein GOBAR_DD02861 [Gossypium barbadense]
MHQSPHVLIFPFPAQGHVNSMLKLAELLALASLKVTFLNSKYNHECLVCHIYILSHFTQYPGFKFETIPDGLPQDHPLVLHAVGDMFESLELITHLWIESFQSKSYKKLHYLKCRPSVPKSTPFDLSMSISRQDLPPQIGHCLIGPRIFCQGQLTEFWFGLVNTGKRFLWVLRPEIVPENDRGHDDVPAELVEGKKEKKEGSGLGSTRGGSITSTLRDQLVELWYGLLNNKTNFLFVVRQDSVIGKDGEGEDVVKELSKKSKARGYIVDWAPQEAVLNHLAIGRFLTHSGWNSTLENMLPGVVSAVWKIGLDMKDVCDRKIVEKTVNDVMVDRKEELAISASDGESIR